MIKHLKCLVVFGFVSLLLAGSSSQASPGNSAETRTDTFSVELLGRGILYSLDYDHMVSPNLAAGAGLSFFSLGADSSDGSNVHVSALVIPLYVNYYFQQGAHRGFLTGGLDLAFVSAAADDSDTIHGSGAFPIIGGGYEYRGDNGFLFRAAPYLLIGNRVALTIGLGFGFAL